MYYFIRMWKFLFIFLIVPVTVWGQGLPHITVYDSETYKNWRQNWVVIQDSSQYILIGNGTGVMQFDGIEWKSIHLPNNGIVRSFHSWKQSIYVGGESEFGVLSSDSLYNFRFVDLADKIVDKPPHYSEIWSVKSHDGKLLFGTREGLFEMGRDSVFYHSTENELGGYIFDWGDEKLVLVANVGLATFKEQKFEKIEGSEIYIGDRLYVVLPFMGEHLLISRKNGFMIYNGKQFEPFQAEAEAYINKHKIYRGTYINKHQIALATLSGGIVIINLRGEIVNILKEEDGLPTDIIYELFVDHEETLWVATDNGLAKILVNNPVTKYDERLNFSGIPVFMEMHNNKMYVGSTEGIFLIDRNEKISKLDGNISRAYGGFSQNGTIWLNAPEGIYNINVESPVKITSTSYRRFIPTNQENEFYGANRNVIHKLEKNGRTRLDITAKMEVPFPIHWLSLIENRLWVLPGNGPVYSYKKSGELIKKYTVAGDTTLGNEWIKKVEGTIYLGSVEGLYELDPTNDEFVQTSLTADEELTGKQVNAFKKCGDDYWFRNNRKIKRLNITQNSSVLLTEPYNLIDEGESITVIECGNNRSVWFAGSAGIYHLSDPDWKYETSFNTNITGVLVAGDSLIYGGYGEQEQAPQLKYRENSLRFTFSAASYIAPEYNEYRVRLRGYDDNWSNWTNETAKDYTFISEGTYSFEVQSKNIYNKLGSVDRYTFTVLPPWYRTWWAYSGYLILIIGTIYLGYRIRITQILKEYKIRNNIADDLHDEISATLTSISYFAEAASRQKTPKKDKYVNLIGKSAVEAKEKITDIVWAINPENDNWNSFLAKCRRFASDLIESKNIRYDFEINKKPKGRMRMEIRQNLWLMFKEIVTNAVRHSGASKINISFNYDKKMLIVKVQDNGDGFDPDSTRRGNGVRTIKKRAGEIRGEAQIKTEPDLGTRWIIKIAID